MNQKQLAVKRNLMRAYRIDQHISSKLDQIASLHDLATRAGNNISDMPKSPNKNIHRLEDIIVKILDLETELNAEVDQLLDVKKEIMGYISQVKGREGQIVLERRYLCFDRWEDIAGEFGYSVRHIYRIHDEAIKNIRIP